MKTCKACGFSYPETSFYKSPTNRNPERRQTCCRYCFASRYRKYPLRGTKTDRIASSFGKPFPQLLHELRAERGWSVAQILNRLHISQRTFFRYYSLNLTR